MMLERMIAIDSEAMALATVPYTVESIRRLYAIEPELIHLYRGEDKERKIDLFLFRSEMFKKKMDEWTYYDALEDIPL